MNDPANDGALRALLVRRPPAFIRPGLQPVRRLLARLGDPQRELRVVHVAGTNGKGSVIAFLEAMLRAAGIPVGVFTSPHLERFNERIRVDGREITDEALDTLLTETLAHDQGEETTFFELTTAAALLWFARAGRFCRRGPGVVLLETGLGGRLDATNVATPCLSLITSIGLDHEDFLGPTLAGIAREKGGVLKPGVPAVIAPASREATRILTAMARWVGAPLAVEGRDFFRFVPVSDGAWRFRERSGALLRLPAPALPGGHQYANAALAVAGARVLQRLGLPLTATHMRAGVARARWPGRLECFPGPPPVWLDGAHNPDAVRSLVRFLSGSLDDRKKTPCTLIFSVMNNKNALSMVRQLLPWVGPVFTVMCGGERGRSLVELVELWRQAGGAATPCRSVREALDQARDGTGPEGRILVTGSLFLVGEVRSLLLYQDSRPTCAGQRAVIAY
ncbi:MAG: bifunctional folylpolyglutamate synthase/dihydrofolate synthase [Magnetococcales bacterium]|nr:bifunctional folylpolyglutamate synthase/dihydrofolate synthase [Magnetococcales bacterium]